MGFQHDNASVARSKYTSNWLKDASFKNEYDNIASKKPRLELHRESICHHKKVYNNGRQFINLKDLCGAIKD